VNAPTFEIEAQNVGGAVLTKTYLTALLSVFFRWWWAALTGVLTIVAFFATPPEGLSVSGAVLAITSLTFLTLAFLTLSTLVVSWRWFSESGMHPVVERIVSSHSTGGQITFVVKSLSFPIGPGTFLALFRVSEYDIEACAAVLEVVAERKDGKGHQAEPRWISDAHKLPLQKGTVKADDLRLRVVSREVLDLVARCAKDEV
jgi:hypothetical protein